MPGRNLCLLSLDGGGVRGLSSLFILKHLMESIADEADLDGPPKPCEYFDMIAGTSTGGLIAIMLGRLQMSVDECIAAYSRLADSVFKKKHHRVRLRNGDIQGRFDSQALEDSIKSIVQKCCDKGDEELLKDVRDAPCKVAVFATSAKTSSIVPLTSYRRPRGGSDRLAHVRIWEAGRATSAASSFFDPITIDMGSYTEEFVDGATGANNPIQWLWTEARDYFNVDSLEDNLRCIVSVGTGESSIEPFKTNLKDIVGTLTRVATDTESTAESFHRQHSSLAQQQRYFRFNVRNGLQDVGLEESDQLDKIVGVTNLYVESEAVFQMRKQCGKALAERQYALNISRALIPVDRGGNNRRTPYQMNMELSTKLSRNILDSISSYDPEKTFRRFFNKRVQGTTAWFVEHAEFQNWLNEDRTALLWCTGKVGCGKTMIATSLIEHLLGKEHDEKTPVLHYYCETVNGNPLEVTRIIEGLIHQQVTQILSKADVVPANIVEKLNRYYSRSGPTPDFDDVKQLFVDLLKRIPLCYYVIDGLDEASGDGVDQMLDLIKGILRAGKRQKIAIFSRAQLGRCLDATKIVPDQFYIEISKDVVDTDISLFLEEMISEKSTKYSVLTKDPLLLEKIKNQLCDEAEGMFLWARLQIDALCSECTTPEQIDSALKSIPKELDEVYLRCLQRIPTTTIFALASKVFLWVACATRPLDIDELREAVAFDETDTEWSSRKIPLEDFVRNTFTNLITVDAVDHKIRFIHDSVRQFLLECDKVPDLFRIDRASAELSCGLYCVRYLSFTNFVNTDLQRQNPGTVHVAVPPPPSRLALLPWTSSITKRFLTPSLPVKATIHLPYRTSKTPISFKFYEYARKNWALQTKSINRQSLNYQSFETLACNLNSVWPLHPWERSGQSRGSHMHDLLLWAVRHSHTPLVDVFFSNTTKAEANELAMKPAVEDLMLPIHVAASGEDLSMFMKLLKVSSLSAVDTRGWAPLHHAAEKGRVRIIEVIVQRLQGTPKNAFDLWYTLELSKKTSDMQTPLLIALKNHQQEAARLLFEAQYDGNIWLSNMRCDFPHRLKHPHWVDLDELAAQGNIELGARLIAALKREMNSSSPKDFPEQRFRYYNVLAGARRVAFSCRQKVFLELLSNEYPPVEATTRRNPLFRAIFDRNFSAVASILKRGANPNIVDPSGENALSMAISNRDVTSTGYLLAAGANPSAKDKNGKHLLASEQVLHDEDLVNELLYAGANIHLLDGNEIVRLQQTFVRCRGAKLFQGLILAGIDVDSKDRSGYTALNIAVIHQDDLRFDILVQEGADPNKTSNHDYAPLIESARKSSIKFISSLISLGASVQAQGYCGDTALHVCVKSGQVQHVPILIGAGVDLNTKNERGDTALQIACRTENELAIKSLCSAGADIGILNKRGYSALHEAVLGGFSQALNTLISASANLDSASKKGFTPLHLSIMYKYSAARDKLISAGAGLEVRDSKGRTALLVAIVIGDVFAVNALLAAGANSDTEDSKDNTPLTLLIDPSISGRDDRDGILHKLLEYRADINKPGHRGETPLSLACEYGELALIKILLEKGANPNQETASGISPLEKCVRNLDVDGVKALLVSGAFCEQSKAITLPHRPYHRNGKIEYQWTRPIQDREDVLNALSAAGCKWEVEFAPSYNS